jgi:DNA-binding NtrC family response regulator
MVRCLAQGLRSDIHRRREAMKQRLLAVDDEPHKLKLLERIITEKTPYQIKTTSHSLEVPEILEQNQFDLIIADLKMPALDGLDLLRLVKEKERFEEVVIITAFGSLQTAIEALSLDVFDYITKPFKKEQIIFTINRAMRWQQMKRDAARMDELFGMEPWEEAHKVFEREYVGRLRERCGGDEIVAAERSGLPFEKITSLRQA